ncbi:transposase [Cohnella mopanensis]|uniref:transposase n=1 Tax=Cohnella mopanensis TaxID=2911966 RepID=UPI001EF89661|nr:transposase [Cohnella mopanensis]
MQSSQCFEHFCSLYNSEEKCIAAFFDARWPTGFCCPHCSHRQFYLIRTRKLPLYECRDCHIQTSLTAGTILEGSRTPLKLWFQALYLHSLPTGISATKLTSIIGTTYKTAWLICHKIRHAMSSAESRELLSGVVRVNWGVYGHPYNPTIFRHPQEQPLLAGGTIDSNDQIIHLKIKQISDNHLIHDRITRLGSLAFTSQYVDPAVTDLTVVTQKFSRNRSNALISLCNRASNWMNLVFNGIGPKHLQSYLDQFCFSFNRVQSGENIFNNLLQYSASTSTLKYPELVSRANHSKLHKRNYFHLLREAC